MERSNQNRRKTVGAGSLVRPSKKTINKLRARGTAFNFDTFYLGGRGVGISASADVSIGGYSICVKPNASVTTFRKVWDNCVMKVTQYQDGTIAEEPIYTRGRCKKTKHPIWADDFIRKFQEKCYVANGGEKLKSKPIKESK